MTEQLKSLIRHVLTAIGFIVSALGLTEWTGLIDLFAINLDTIWAAITTLLGFITLVIGFFKDKTRHDERVEGVNALNGNKK